jgi:hypothetical protein
MRDQRQMLAEVEQHIAEGDRCVTKQLEMIAYMRSKGLDTEKFEQVLAEFEDTQRDRFTLRGRLLRQLYA